MAVSMRIVRNCYFKDCKMSTEVEFKNTSCRRTSSYCDGCATPLDVKVLVYEHEISIIIKY